MKLTHNGPEFDWKHKTELFKAEINFLFDQAQLQGSINIYLTEHMHNKHFPDLLLEVLQRNAEYKTHFQIQSNSDVIVLSCQKGESLQRKDQPKLDALLKGDGLLNMLHNPLLPSKSGSPRELSPNEAAILKEALPPTQGWPEIKPSPNFGPLHPFHHPMENHFDQSQLNEPDQP